MHWQPARKRQPTRRRSLPKAECICSALFLSPNPLCGRNARGATTGLHSVTRNREEPNIPLTFELRYGRVIFARPWPLSCTGSARRVDVVQCRFASVWQLLSRHTQEAADEYAWQAETQLEAMACAAGDSGNCAADQCDHRHRAMVRQASHACFP
ncbi:conserved hypothetical protein [Stenotrophomonas maltophilia]|nr:conserved hypothetical protein [Stenotrophomonas maltophilia]